MLTFRKAVPADLPGMMNLVHQAQAFMATLNIDQWQDGYPTREIAEEDVALSRSYAVEIDGEVCATFVLQLGGDKNYDVIERGEWLSGNENRDYLAIHRVAIAVASRGRGIAAQMISYAADLARERGLSSLRIDTHEGNVVMRRMLEKNGFTYCGVIYLENGDARVAYERII